MSEIRELKFKRGQLVKLCNPPTTEDERTEQYWDNEIDGQYVGRVGRIIDTDQADAILTYMVQFHTLPGDEYFDNTRWYPEGNLKEAKPWQVKKYNKEKLLTV